MYKVTKVVSKRDFDLVSVPRVCYCGLLGDPQPQRDLKREGRSEKAFEDSELCREVFELWHRL